MTTTSFFVPGTPAPQGSKRYLGNGRMVESSKRVKPWRADIRAQALQTFKQPLTGAIRLDLHFVMPRPNSHYGTGRNAHKLKESAPASHIQKPDLDKLVRAVGDALTGVAYVDDSQVVGGAHMKRWTDGASDRAGVYVTVVPLEEKAA
ncbi:MAG: RusA family crossover junction endodeoxyribonuclease [Schaalia turicensis]|nr:RusA family crossover junction endodeoxyribonuclease [Schaalia turicensis]